MRQELTGTKKLIFDHSLALIAENGYEKISMREIAAGIGITSASIYNHYINKQQILEHFYAYYAENKDSGRISYVEMKALIERGTRDQLVEALTDGSFVRLEEEAARRMMLITKLIYARMFSDPEAAALFRNNMETGRAFIERLLEYGVEKGRFRPCNIKGYAYAFVAMYFQMGVESFIQPGYSPGEPESEKWIKVWIGQQLELLEQWPGEKEQ